MMDDWLQEAMSYIPSWLSFQLRDSDQAGCAIAIMHKEHIVLDHAIGFANLATKELFTPRHRFRVASHSKAFTAAGIMLLRDRGRLGLDDAVGRHVPGLHPDVAEATIAQVLSHSAGLTRDGMASGQFQDLRPFADTEEILTDLHHPPVIERNTAFKYSNHGYALLGLVIEAITAETYTDWIRREIITASGLNETGPDMPLLSGAPFSRGHTGKLPLGQRLVVAGDYQTHAITPAGGFVSTAADLVRFFSQLSPRAEGSPLSIASRREMIRGQWKTTPHSTLTTTYGLGTMSGTLGRWKWFGHSGSLLGYMSRTAVVSDENLAVSLLVNGADGPAWPWLDGALHVLMAFSEHGAPSEAVRDWSGRWWSRFGAIDLLAMGNKVVVACPAFFNPLFDAAEIAVESPDEGRITRCSGYGSHGERVRLVRDGTGKIVEFWIAESRLVPEDIMVEELRTSYGAS